MSSLPAYHYSTGQQSHSKHMYAYTHKKRRDRLTELRSLHLLAINFVYEYERCRMASNSMTVVAIATFNDSA